MGSSPVWNMQIHPVSSWNYEACVKPQGPVRCWGRKDGTVQPPSLPRVLGCEKQNSGHLANLHAKHVIFSFFLSEQSIFAAFKEVSTPGPDLCMQSLVSHLSPRCVSNDWDQGWPTMYFLEVRTSLQLEAKTYCWRHNCIMITLYIINLCI